MDPQDFYTTLLENILKWKVYIGADMQTGCIKGCIAVLMKSFLNFIKTKPVKHTAYILAWSHHVIVTLRVIFAIIQKLS